MLFIESSSPSFQLIYTSFHYLKNSCNPLQSICEINTWIYHHRPNSWNGILKRQINLCATCYWVRKHPASLPESLWIETFFAPEPQSRSDGRHHRGECQPYFPLCQSTRCLFNSNWNLIPLFAHHFPRLVIPHLNSI